ncbi:MAG: putative lipid II flippase FtsW, partial [Acidimicrobiia bacterium]|nr:putative lipid II flippase FtsW [Acidimicrobiia bacterium]
APGTSRRDGSSGARRTVPATGRPSGRTAVEPERSDRGRLDHEWREDDHRALPPTFRDGGSDDGIWADDGRERPAVRSRGTGAAPITRSRSAGPPTGRSSAQRRPAASSRSRSASSSGRAPARRSGSGIRNGRPSGAGATRRRVTPEATAGFRSRRRPEPGRGGGRSSRRSHPPVTEVGERMAAYLTATFLGLTLFGLVMVLSASSVSSLHQLANSPFFQFKRQALWAGVGAVAFVVASRIDYRRVRFLAGPSMLVTLALLVAVLVPGLGIAENGSRRWLGVGPMVIQPSELAKLSLIVFVADLLARRERRMDRPELTVRPVMLILVILSGLIVVQPKLGTPIIMSSVVILMLFVSGARMRSLLSWVTVAGVAATILAYSAPYRRQRLLAFMDPWKDPLGIGMQSVQSQVGIASGGLYGVGLGASRAKWGFLPFAYTDFIFAIVAEEVGLIGASALIGGFLLIAWLGLRTALGAPDRFGTLLAAGITCWLLVQAFLNIGMVLGVLPITGEALPFISAGGSSLVVTLTAAGLLTSVARRIRT